jgi:hypothetical protein
MTDGRTKQAQEIHALLAERRKYEEWLAQLEARKGTTPDHVFLRVKGDYAARLAEAQKKLSAESGAVRALATELEKTLAAQERQIAGRADERAEAEVRAAVGEFAGKEWDKLRAKLDSAIADLSGERDATQRELDTLHALLADAESAEPEAEPPDADAPNGDVDDIAFLRSVLGTSTPYVASTPATGAPERPAIEPPTVPRAVPRASAPVEKRRSVPVAAPVDAAEVTPEPAPARSPRPEPEPAAPSAESRAPAAATARAAAAPREAAPEAFAAPEVPEEPSGPRGTDDRKQARLSGTFGRDTPRTSEAVKSLKCQECGTLNHPTEWYCERCGGELAAF